ncbi:YopJ family acetyltransferase [Morganella sp. GD04133]|uniref:YopJ family acetyltransferase n=1 Tax=Morganella sp. GD04133 TaxID=2975435 RepID=UPI00244BED31|nr:YopJ family acetyltransferase [Morganella sp. GD04133]MDH0354264.1 hypothetical protein [Morganella sp. GD04133]
MIRSISPINSPVSLSNEHACSFISDEKLKNIIIQLENDIADNSWYNNSYSMKDMEIMPALVIQANDKYPEMNLNFVESPQYLSEEIKKNNRPQS